jgi:GT2 family glycosyltransferase
MAVCEPMDRVAMCTAVIVNYRCADQTVACVASLRRWGLRVVVVDNASGDGSVEALRRALPDVELVVSDRNRGFGGGCNLGFERALRREVDYVLLLNPDAEAEPRLLDELLAEAARHPEAGIVGGRVLGMDGRTVQYEAGRFPWWSLSGLHARATAEDFETEFVTGALMLIDGDLLRDGLRFDENYFLYVEDLDLCREVIARGRTLRVNTRARIRHREGGTQAGDAVLGGLRPLQLECMTRGKVYFARKRLSGVRRLVALATICVLKPVAGVLRYGRVGFLPLYFRALRDGFRLPVRRSG